MTKQAYYPGDLSYQPGKFLLCGELGKKKASILCDWNKSFCEVHEKFWNELLEFIFVP